ncbi:hypothetical protein [Hamadaea tsunoensis]|uniref:hypothetical protein n=1 Tax=Hamadaea tsunoensis TaxID=53368 RepID=UPI0004287480|nr:hypothetical protein [Hamadaea tsunoensis]
MSHDDDLPEELGRLRNEIANEIYAQLMIRQGRIRQEDVGGVAYAVAQRLRQGFRIEWAPWEDEPADEDLISIDAATWRAG